MTDKNDTTGMTGMDLLGMHRLAAENGDGFTPAFLDVMMRAQLEAAGPRLVVSNDRALPSRRPADQSASEPVTLMLVDKPATAV